MGNDFERLARAYLEKRRIMEAMVVAKKAIEAHPRPPPLWMLLAEVYAAGGKDDRAREAREEAARLELGRS